MPGRHWIHQGKINVHRMVWPPGVAEGKAVPRDVRGAGGSIPPFSIGSYRCKG